MAPSEVYTRLLELSNKHANPSSMEEIMGIRSPDAIHAWGHNYLVSRNPKLGERMDNKDFEAHLISTGPYLESCVSEIHTITVDEHRRTSTVHMSYFLQPAQSDEKVEQDLIWTLRFTDDEEVDKIMIEESVEFIDAAASGRVGEIIRGIHGTLNENVRGGITL